jgi:TrmH family RNA methyltransferase
MLISPHNPRLARIRALLEKKKARDDEQAFVVEGVRLVEEAQAAGWQPELVLYSAQLSERGLQVIQNFRQQGAEVWEIAPGLMDTLTRTETAPGLLAVMPIRRLPIPETLSWALITDNLRDPGNLGTLLRTAAAAGVEAALLSPGTTDAFAPKVMRAGMGAHFRLPIYHLSWDEIRAFCKQPRSAGSDSASHLRVFLAEAARGSACWDTNLRQPLALMVGSEAEGASPQALALADDFINIPMPGLSESLNAAIAASILIFEIVRQRRLS